MAEAAFDLYSDVPAAARNGNGSDPGLDHDHLQAIILAGGRGTRLAPYTSILPKPLMPVGDRAILELVVDQLVATGVTKVSFCVGYLAHLIRAVFDHRENGLEIVYVHEPEALGTAAPLRLVEGLDSTFLVMNGDVLTTLDYGDLLRHHRASGNVLTIATNERSIKIDYGMLHLDVSERVRDFEEKPEIHSRVSMGIYVMEPSVLQYIPDDRAFDFPDLVRALLRTDERVGAYCFSGMWFDIGRADDYERAVSAWVSGHYADETHTNGGPPHTNGGAPHTNGGAPHTNGSAQANGSPPHANGDVPSTRTRADG